MTRPKAIKKAGARTVRMSRYNSAREAIGQIEKGTDTFILTYGQFSLIDALCAILVQTGPADVSLSTWTAAHAHLERSAELMESAAIRSFRLIVDRSFEGRQPEYAQHMRDLFGPECVRAIRTHAKFMLIRNEEWDIVVRTSMNLNENPRLENIEISEGLGFAEFFQTVVDDVFAEVKPGENASDIPGLHNVQESFPFRPLLAKPIPQESLNEVRATHTIPAPDSGGQ
mgnify:CR=1 FL=1|jgi:hypothetical protein